MDIPSPDEIINGGKAKAKPTITGFGIIDQDHKQVQLSPDQQKAIGIVLSGNAYVLVGIKPTIGDQGNPGADFFTVLDGNTEHLRDAKEALPGVIDRAYARGGIL